MTTTHKHPDGAQGQRHDASSLKDAGHVQAMIGRAAQLSEQLRAKAEPFDKLAWDLDSKSALIRRHQNGGSPIPNGTIEEQFELAGVLAKAEATVKPRKTVGERMLVETVTNVVSTSAEIVADLLQVLEDHDIAPGDIDPKVAAKIARFTTQVVLIRALGF